MPSKHYSNYIIHYIKAFWGKFFSHLFSKRLCEDAALMSKRSSTLAFKQAFINYLLSFETEHFGGLGKFTLFAFSMMP